MNLTKEKIDQMRKSCAGWSTDILHVDLIALLDAAELQWAAENTFLLEDVCLRCMQSIGEFTETDEGHTKNMAAHECIVLIKKERDAALARVEQLNDLGIREKNRFEAKLKAIQKLTEQQVMNLHRYFENTWMCNPRFLSISAHIWFGCSLIEAVWIHWGVGKAWIALLVLALCAAAKEFWFDATFELPKQTGRDNWEGFISYILGGYLGIAIITWWAHAPITFLIQLCKGGE